MAQYGLLYHNVSVINTQSSICNKFARIICILIPKHDNKDQSTFIVVLSLFYTLRSLSFSRLECRLNGLNSQTRKRATRNTDEGSLAQRSRRQPTRNATLASQATAQVRTEDETGAVPPSNVPSTSSRITIRTSHAVSSPLGS